MKSRLLLLLAVSLSCGTAAAEQGFDGLKCDADIAKALVGRHMPNDKIDVLQARHKDLQLKSLGGDELEWGNAEWWQICGTTYSLLLDKHDIIRDALKLPTPAGTAVLEGACKGVHGEVIGVVENQAGAADLPAKAAWRIDNSKKRFVPVPADGLLCSRDGLLESSK